MTEPNNRPDWGPLANRVEELALSKSEENRAIGINLMYDHRISEARIAHFQESVKASVFAGVNAEEREQALLNALVQYRTQKVARLPNETFADRASNSRNQISADPKTLVHVCNVSQKLFRIATSGRRLGAEVTQAIDRLGTGLIALGRLDRVDAFLRATLRDPETKYEFVVNFLELLRAYRETVAWHPVWSASWEEFENASHEMAAGTWFHAVGVPCEKTPLPWVLILKYPSDLVSRIFRPSQLEAGFSPYHFPSPPQASSDKGGYCMHLAASPLGVGPLVPEYIHVDCDFEVGHWVDGGMRLDQVYPTPARPLMRCRMRHHSLLSELYTAEEICNWMPDPCTWSTMVQ